MNSKTYESMSWHVRGGVLAAVAVAVVAGSSPLASAAGGPSLGVASSFAALGGSTVSNTGLSMITGDVGVSPGTEINGFPPGTVTGGALHPGDALATQAHADAALAYNFLAGMASIPANNLSDTDLGGRTLSPGVYKFNTSAQLTGDLTLDAGGDSGALFVFQIGSTLTTASNASVIVINGGANYDESNIYWQVGSSATLGSGTAFTGNILAYASITVVSGSSMLGNALALVGAVTMDSNGMTSAPAAGPPPPPAGVPLAPNNLIAAPIVASECTQADLSWTDASDNETEFRVFRRDGAGPDFVLAATIPSTDTAGTGGVVTYMAQDLDPTTTHTYRVTAFGAADGESAFSNESRLEACDDIVIVPPVVVPPRRWLDVQLGRRRSLIRDGIEFQTDRVVIRGSYTVIDVDTSVPTVLHDADPRADGVTIQISAPGSVAIVTIPANDPNWRVSRMGVYRWRSHDGRDAPASRLRINTRKSEFSLRSKRTQFAADPVNSITVSMTCQGATGSDTRGWVRSATPGKGTKSRFNTPR